jgi:hypothetical protein
MDNALDASKAFSPRRDGVVSAADGSHATASPRTSFNLDAIAFVPSVPATNSTNRRGPRSGPRESRASQSSALEGSQPIVLLRRGTNVAPSEKRVARPSAAATRPDEAPTVPSPGESPQMAAPAATRRGHSQKSRGNDSQKGQRQKQKEAPRPSSPAPSAASEISSSSSASSARRNLDTKSRSRPSSSKPRRDVEAHVHLSTLLRTKKYECPICYEVVHVSQSVFSCRGCFSIMHLQVRSFVQR